MDPQRQYAQLLTLWSQGSKLFRREAHYRQRADDEWDLWWRLGRRLVERGLLVVPVPLGSPVLLVATETLWMTLSGRREVEEGIARGVVVVVQDEGPALEWDGRFWTIRRDVALSLGARGWGILGTWHKRDARASWQAQSLDEAITWLAAWYRHPKVFAQLSSETWLLAARAMRHPGGRFEACHPLPQRLGFGYDVDAGQIWWTRQDEDSVHKR